LDEVLSKGYNQLRETKKMKYERLDFSGHAVRRMFERGIAREDVRNVIDRGEVIADYKDDEPLPSRLMLGFVEGRPLHVVVAFEPNGARAVVITAYDPDPAIWKEGFRFRKETR
jgi:hypothetical protein